MPGDSCRSPVFTYQSTVQSNHVLRCLDEQRRSDLFCDVTVVVENQSFRAHRSVLASCSDYFSFRFRRQGEAGEVITLPQEVNVEGFVPLLEFAYTTKLIFSEENILEVRNCATFLGFKNVDSTCYDFLIPKSFTSSQSATPRKQCCQMKKFLKLMKDPIDESLDDKAEQLTPDDQEPYTNSCSNVRNDSQKNCDDDGLLVTAKKTNYSLLCSYRKFQMACLEAFSPEASSISTATSAERYCMSPQTLGGSEGLDEAKLSDTVMPLTEGRDPHTMAAVTHSLDSQAQHSDGRSSARVVKLERVDDELFEGNMMQSRLKAKSGDEEGLHSTSHLSVPSKGDSGQETDIEPTVLERSSIEQEVAEQLATGFWSETCSSKPSGTTPMYWLQQLDQHMSSNKMDCPFLKDLHTMGNSGFKGGMEMESQAQGSPYVVSLNSGEDSDSLDTEGDSESNSNDLAVKLPFSIERIASLSRNDFQQMLKLQCLTREQVDFVHDVRRRSKNRIAARRCRKRKMDCIHNLESEIEKLRMEKEKLTEERDKLSQQRFKTWQNLSGLYKHVCNEAAPRPEQLQVLAKYSPPACPLFTLLSPVKSVSTQPDVAPSHPQNLTEVQARSTTGSTDISQSDNSGIIESSKILLNADQTDSKTLLPPGLCPTLSFPDSSPTSAFTSIRPEPVSRLISDM